MLQSSIIKGNNTNCKAYVLYFAPLMAKLQGMLPVGFLIDLENKKAMPECAWSVQVKAGNARKAKQFRVERVSSVKINSRHPALSKWTCEAVPISPATGKDMKATTSNHYRSDERTTVTLEGSLLADFPLERDETAAFIQLYS